MSAREIARHDEAFESLEKEHHAQLYAMAHRLTGNHDDAQDLLQQSLVEAFLAFERFAPGTRFDRWVRLIMYHSFLDGVRRRPRPALLSLDTLWESGEGSLAAVDLAGERMAPEDRLLNTVLSEPLERALATLPIALRSVLELADMHGMSYDEIARRLRCPIGTVRSRLHRARAMMRRALGVRGPMMPGGSGSLGREAF